MKLISHQDLKKGNFYLFYFRPKDEGNFRNREFYIGQYCGVESGNFIHKIEKILVVRQPDYPHGYPIQLYRESDYLTNRCEIFLLIEFEYLSNVIFED